MQLKSKYIDHYRFFYRFLGVKIWVGLALKFIVGLLDGLGLALFFPLFKLAETNEIKNTENLGALKYLVDGFELLNIPMNLESILILLSLLFILKGTISFVEGRYRVKLQQLFVTKMRYESIEMLSNLSYLHFLNSDSGRIQSTLSGEVVKVVQAYSSLFGVLQNIVLIIVYVALAMVANVQFAIFVALGGLLTNFFFRFIFKRTQQLSDSLTVEGHRYQGLLIQMIAFFKYLKATDTVSKYKKRLNSSVRNVERFNTRIGILKAFVLALREPLIILVVVAVLYVQVRVFEQSITVMILSLMFFYRALSYLMTLQNNWNAFLAVSGSLKNIKNFSTELMSNREHSGGAKYEGFNHSISINQGVFQFDSQEQPALNNISIKIEKNTTAAFVGLSGSGKTTLINVLSGLLPLNSGEVLIDDIKMSDMDIKSYRHRIGYITQEPIIFNDTLFNNVAFFDEPTEENYSRFWNALEQASLNEFVQQLPNREQAKMGINGLSLSGGQKQRVSIARELYKDIDILIMDEATSALDSETERIVQESVDNLQGSLTILVIAHRLSTIKYVDEVFFMKEGEILDKGSFDELYSSNVEFKRLVDLQKL